MKLYTRTGDDGSTGLFGGRRVGKDDLRLDAYGTVDECNAHVGAARAVPLGKDAAAAARLDQILAAVQSRLFDLGADLATPDDSPGAKTVRRLDAADVAEAERWIDEVDGGNPPIRTFILPGGGECAARLHVARTVCRRAERLMVALSRREMVNPQAIIWVNRLSDLLFALARRVNALHGISDTPWSSRPAK